MKDKNERMIISLNNKIEKKKEEWVKEIYKCDSNKEEKLSFEESTHLLVESKEYYEFLIEVDEANQTAQIVSFEKGTGEKYTVTYHPNGGEGQEETKEIRQGFSITLKDCNYKKNQYKFVGWCENKNGEGTRFLEGSKYYPKNNVTLYAIWEAEVVTITFNNNGGTGEMKERTVTKGQSTKLPQNTFTKSGYEFKGWAISKDRNRDKI